MLTAFTFYCIGTFFKLDVSHNSVITWETACGFVFNSHLIFDALIREENAYMNPKT